MKSRKISRGLFCLAAAAMFASLAGCVDMQTKPPPVTIAEYKSYVGSGMQTYNRQTILFHNLQRVGDSALPEAQRVDSLDVVSATAEAEPTVGQQLVVVSNDSATPSALRERINIFLRKSDIRIDPTIVANTQTPKVLDPGDLKGLLEKYARDGGQITDLIDVVSRWAQQVAVNGPMEDLFRKAAVKIAGQPWPEALVASINAPDFTARGSAIDVLAHRMAVEDIGKMILRLQPKTEAMAALQVFLERFEFVPSNAGEFTAVVTMYKSSRELINDAAKLWRNWHDNYGYSFNIRDFHLLSQIARDPLREPFRATIPRRKMVMDLNKAFTVRVHASCAADPLAKEGGNTFMRVADKLTLADMWNLQLINDMLSLPRVQYALRTMSVGDRNDKTGVWGGLIFYRNGMAEALLYPPDNSQGPNDLEYVPTKRLQLDNYDAVARFNGHFEQAANGARAGPTQNELAAAKKGNFYGLVITSIGEETFAAHYYNPAGVIVSLGTFPFRK
ncbi:MAG: hypothetical protein HZA50_18275 [Planctomycetes bacterium]|nr:hypothetical protein [Planctomycetota bacterium]